MIIKNSNLRQNLFRNRYKILGIIVAIILVLLLIRTLNEFAKQANQKEKSKNIVEEVSSYKPQQTVISGENVSNTKQEENTKIMDEFIDLCNKREIEKAYNLLTDECKEEMFDSSIQKFKKDYIEKIFTVDRTYNMQSWINGENQTYKVKILEDAMSTGKTGEIIEEYYTIVKKDGKSKLNINSYVEKKKVNKKITKDNITIEILERNIFMEYEIYKIKVQNNTDNTILLDTKEKEKSAYITGSNSATYSAFMYEIDEIYLTIQPQIYREIDVKFNKIYNPSIKTRQITFTDIVPNLEEYDSLKNKSEYKSKMSITIEL